MTLSAHETELLHSLEERIAKRLAVQLDHVAGRRLSYRPDEAAAVLGVGRDAIFAAIADGSMRSYKAGRSRLISSQALLDWIADREQEEAEERGAA